MISDWSILVFLQDSIKHLEDVTIEVLTKFLRLVSHRACSTLILDLVASDEDFEKEYQLIAKTAFTDNKPLKRSRVL